MPGVDRTASFALLTSRRATICLLMLLCPFPTVTAEAQEAVAFRNTRVQHAAAYFEPSHARLSCVSGDRPGSEHWRS